MTTDPAFIPLPADARDIDAATLARLRIVLDVQGMASALVSCEEEVQKTA